MADESSKITAQYIPTRGLNRHFDPSLFGSEFAFTLKNFVIDRGVLRTRDGLTKFESHQMDARPNGIYLGRFIDSTGAITEAMLVKYGASLSLVSSDGVTAKTLSGGVGVLEATTKGSFFQYGNFIYYTARPTTPSGGHQVLKYGADGVIRRAGCPSPDRELPLIGEATSISGWSSAPTLDTNKSHFYVGNGWFKLTIASETTPTTTTYTKTMSAKNCTLFLDGSACDDTAYVAFTLYRFKKANVTSLKIQCTSTGGTYECTVFDVVSTTHPWKVSSSFAQTWEDDYRDYHIFDIRLKKAWFKKTSSPNWNAITSVSFVMTSSAKASTNNPAELTVSNIRIQSSPPIPCHGKVITDMENTGAWTLSGSAAFSTLYKTEGVYSMYLPAGGSASWATGGLDLLTVEEGSALTSRDMITASVACVNSTPNWISGGTLTIVLTDHAGKTLTLTYFDWNFAGIPGASVNFKKVTRILLPIAGVVAYSSGGFKDFGWSDIHTVAMTAGAGGPSFYVDNIRILRGQYKKFIANFTPGITDVATLLNDEPVQNLFNNLPKSAEMTEIQVAAGAIGWLSDFFNSWGKYITFGTGAYLMPDFDNSERGAFSYASMTITAGGECVPNAGGVLASGLGGSDVEGFRVVFPFPYILDILDSAPLDLTNYGTTFFGISNDADVLIDSSDYVRCWMKISKPGKLLKVKFRLYTDAASSSSGQWYNPSKDDSDNSFYEYVWDASNVMNKAYMEAAGRQSNLYLGDETASALNQIAQYANQSYFSQTKAPSGTPEWVIEGAKYLGGDELSNFLGVAGSADNKKKQEGMVVIAKWKMSDFAWMGSGVEVASMANIVAIGIEVVPIPGETVAVSFDNWYIFKSGNLAGNYWYCTTFVNEDGEESAPSWPSEMMVATGQDLCVKNLPQSWPTGVVAMNLYRMGGESLEWRLCQTVGSPYNTSTPMSVVDSTVEAELGDYLVDRGFEPPRAEYAVPIGNKVYYGNFYDRYNHLHASSVAISEPHRPGCVKVTNYRDLAVDDGTEITGICDFMGYKVVTKETSVWTLDGDDDLPIKRVSTIGNIAPRSLAVTDKYVIFLSHRGFYTYDTNSCSEDVGMPVKNIIADLMAGTNGQAILKQSIGFVFGDYYWFFYGTQLETVDGATNQVRNNSVLALHIPSGWWTQAQFTLASANDLDVQAAFIDKGKARAYVGSNSTDKKYIYKFLDGKTDDGYTIVQTFDSGHLTFGLAAQEKRVKALYIRLKTMEPLSSAAADCSFSIYPTVEEIRATHEDNAVGSNPVVYTYAHADSFAYNGGSTTGNITNKYKTFCFSNPSAANGFVHQLSMIVNGRVEVSSLFEVLDVLPMRNV